MSNIDQLNQQMQNQPNIAGDFVQGDKVEGDQYLFWDITDLAVAIGPYATVNVYGGTGADRATAIGCGVGDNSR